MRLSDIEDWLTPAEAARAIGISKQHALNLLADKKLRGVKTHQGYLVDPDDAERFRRERAERQEQP
jgi:excisionase family DNA binding protein